MSDQLVTEISITQHSLPLVGFAPTISAVKRPQTYTLDCVAIGTEQWTFTTLKKSLSSTILD